MLGAVRFSGTHPQPPTTTGRQHHGLRTRRLPAGARPILAFAVQDMIDAIDLTMVGYILAWRASWSS